MVTPTFSPLRLLLLLGFFPGNAAGSGTTALKMPPFARPDSRETTVANSVLPQPSSPFHGVAPSFLYHRRLEGFFGDGLHTNPGAKTAGITSEQAGHRDLQDERCTGDAFLWYIRRTNETEVLGFGIGTIHLDRNLVLSDESWSSLQNALGDSCTMYGEVDITDTRTVSDLQKCSSSIALEGTVLLNELPDVGLLEEYRAKLREVVAAYVPNPAEQDSVLALIEQTFPVTSITGMFVAFNTPGPYRESFFETLFYGVTDQQSLLDTDLLELGRPSDAIESLETQCKIVDMVTPNATEFWTHYEEHYKIFLEYSLTASLQPMMDAYRCGDVGIMEAALNKEKQISDSQYWKDVSNFLYDERNLQMARSIAAVLDNQPAGSTRSAFAVGVGHFIGDNNLVTLMEQFGYTLERVTGYYDPDLLPDHSNAICSAADDYFDQCSLEIDTLLDENPELSEIAFDFHSNFQYEVVEDAQGGRSLDIDFPQERKEIYRQACFDSGGRLEGEDDVLSLTCLVENIRIATSISNYVYCITNTEACNNAEFVRIATDHLKNNGLTCEDPSGAVNLPQPPPPTTVEVGEDLIETNDNEVEKDETGQIAQETEAGQDDGTALNEENFFDASGAGRDFGGPAFILTTLFVQFLLS